MGLSKNKKSVIVFAIVVVVVAAVVIGVLAGLGNLFSESEEISDKKCPECSLQKSDWKITGTGDYSARKQSCGNVLVKLADNSISVTRSEESSNEGDVGDAATDFSKKIPEVDDANSLTLSWEVDKTVSDNETMTIVFSDSGQEYAGGNFDGALFKTKPSEGNKKQYLLWTSKANPTYLPFYLSRNDQDKSVCIFADALGAPIEITVRKAATEWVVYTSSEVKFYAYSGDTVQGALDKCVSKWKSIYPVSDTTWSDDFIVGSLTTAQVKADKDRGDSIASHYILSPDVLSLTGNGLEISDKNTIADYGNVFLPLSTKQKVKEDLAATKEKGFYNSESSYILDYDNTAVQETIQTNYLAQTRAGLITDGFLDFPKDGQCPKYFQCSGEKREIDGSTCTSAIFGGGRVFQKHNLYDVSMRKALNPSSNFVIETVASPGTAHFHRTDLELTEGGLKTCYHNVINLRKLGIGAVTCNLCAGVNPVSDEQKSLCFRWSQLSLLMPYNVVSNKDTDLTGELGGAGFVKTKTILELRKQLHYYLASSKDSVQEKKNGVLFGDNLFMVTNMDNTAGSIDVEFPDGEWTAPDPAETSEGSSPESFSQYEEDISKLIFYKLSTNSIFVLKSKDKEDHLVVHIFNPRKDYIANNVTTTFTHNKHSTDITLDPTSKEVLFDYTADPDTNNPINPDDFKVSKLVIYNWIDEVDDTDSPKVRSIDFEIVQNEKKVTKYNVYIDYAAADSGNLKSIFSTWTEKALSGDGGGS